MKILILRLSSIGDIILTQPVARILREHYPQARIDFATKEQFTSLLQYFPEIDQIHSVKKSLSFHRFINQQKYDIVFDLHAKFQSFLIRLCCLSAKRYTYQKKHILRWFIIHKLSQKSIYSTLDLYFSALRKASIKPTFLVPRLQTSHPKSKARWIFFSGATHFTKRLPTHQWIQLINLLSQDYPAEIILHGAPSEQDICAEIFNQIHTSKKQNLCGSQNLSELVDYLQQSSLIFSNDSGPMHLAAALRKPQVAFFGSTTTRLGFRPLNPNAIVFQNTFPCQPCSLHGEKKCPLQHFKCMESFDMKRIKWEIEKQFDLLKLSI